MRTLPGVGFSRRQGAKEKPMPTWSVPFGHTSLGIIRLEFTTQGLASLIFEDGAGPTPAGPEPVWGPALLAPVRRELATYFSGQPTDFSNVILDLDLRGATFQLRVWQALRQIPWGRTVSYRELAARLDRPGGARAVGQALRANPLPLIIPCHRVIAADGGLGGYSGGLARKRWLLRHEDASYLEQPPSAASCRMRTAHHS
jgi:methylated-DNA-[protein]-cysteine S-methyltransferase